jgi:uncharacterized protein CbrC (UPF0167 family)
MSSLSSLAASMRKRAARIEPAMADVMKKAALGVVSDVAKDTPYKTGQAQSNWLTSIGSPMAFYRANELSNTGWRDSVDFAKQVLSNYKTADPIHITNNVPYIVELNRGTSKQAPALFVQAAVLRATYRLKGVKINVG